MNSMRILHVHKYFHERDGAGRYLRTLMRLQERAGHTVAPLAMHDPRNDRSPWEGFFVSTLPTQQLGRGRGLLRQMGRALFSREAARQTRAMLHAFRPDIVHVHNLYTHLSPSVLFACRDAGIPVVATAHDYGFISGNYGLWDGAAPLAADAGLLATARTRFIKGSFFATFGADVVLRVQRRLGWWEGLIARFFSYSRSVRDAYVAAGIPQEKIIVVPPAAETLVRSIPPRDPRTLGTGAFFAGRLEDYKGVRIVLDAARKLPKIPFAFAGSGPLEQELRHAAAELPNVTFLGFLAGEAIWEEMLRSRVVLMPSLSPEPFGLVAYEAQALGVPCSVSDRGGLPEVVEDGVTGFITPAGDAVALARAIEKLHANSALAKKMGIAAAARTGAMGDPETFLRTVMGVYQDVLREAQEIL